MHNAIAHHSLTNTQAVIHFLQPATPSIYTEPDIL